MAIYEPSFGMLPEKSKKEEYMEKIQDILSSYHGGVGARSGPARLLDHLFLGNRNDATDTAVLKRMRINCVLNCAGKKDYSCELKDNPYEADSGVTHYLQFEAIDNQDYPILMHYDAAAKFIDGVLERGDRVLVHCELGINRSGAICAAYMMMHQKLTLLQVLRHIKRERPVVLCNPGFVKQLYDFARHRNLLYKNNTVEV